jgi:hypothetical protein
VEGVSLVLRRVPGAALLPLVLGALTMACSTSSGGAGPADASVTDADHGPDGVASDGGAAADSGNAGSEGSSCACAGPGTCDSFGCPPDYSGPAFAAWCATVQASSAGHQIAMRACGSLLMMTYGTDGGCDRGYVVDQPGGALVATLGECNATVFGCASLEPSACVPACCLDKSCTLGIQSLCPPWQPDAGDTGDGPSE